MTKKQERERARRRWEKQQKTQAARAERRERTKRLAAILGTGIVVAGLVAALRRTFQGASHQRCRVHFARNLLAHVPKSHADMVAAVFRTVFAQPDATAVSNAWDEVRDQLAKSFPKIGPLMDEAKTEVTAFTAFPRAHWQKIWSTNPLERVNKEIKRRARVVGIFPNSASVIRLVGAVLAEQHDAWAEQRRYIGLDVLTRCRHALAPTTTGQEETAATVPALTA